uniref:Uncharacterized protein n=1 Tax=Anguilla anguilla TaxID=7936 RepID=A0A0E9RIZ9_ANGAN
MSTRYAVSHYVKHVGLSLCCLTIYQYFPVVKLSLRSYQPSGG